MVNMKCEREVVTVVRQAGTVVVVATTSRRLLLLLTCSSPLSGLSTIANLISAVVSSPGLLGVSTLLLLFSSSVLPCHSCRRW